MFKFFFWLVACLMISPVLAIVYVIAEIIWVIAMTAKDERDRNRPRSLT